MKKLLLVLCFWLIYIGAALAQAVVPVQMRNADLTTTNTQNYITTSATFSAPRTLTIVDRSSLNAYFIQFIDTAGAVNGANTLTIRVADGSLINGASTLVVSTAGNYIFFAPSATGYSATVVPQTPSGGTPGGSSGQVQYNNAGAFGGFTISGDGTLSTASGVLTLTTVNVNVGSFGSATNCVAFTTNAKGLITAASATTCTPAIGSITGLGTGIATALGINVGSAGAPVLLNGVGGTPSSMIGTNITGTAAGLTAGAVPRTGITGLGTGVATALGNATNSSGGVVTSAGLAANDIVVGGGAGNPPATGAGCSLVSGSIQCSSSSSSLPQYILTNTTSDANAPSFLFKKSRSGGNTLASDALSDMQAYGFANGGYQIPARMQFFQTGASSGSNIPVKLQIQTSNASGQLNQAITFDGNAHLGVTAQATAPTITAGCNGAGSSVSAGASDLHGSITGQTAAATTCTITFGTAFSNVPACTTSGDQSAILTQTRATGTLVVTFASTASYRFSWICAGQ